VSTDFLFFFKNFSLFFVFFRKKEKAPELWAAIMNGACRLRRGAAQLPLAAMSVSELRMGGTPADWRLLVQKIAIFRDFLLYKK